MTGTPLKAAIIPVTPLQQNCCLIWCTKTMRGAFTDPGGDLPTLREAVSQSGVTFEPDRWLVDGDTVTVGELELNVRHCPGHTPGHVVFHHPESKLAIVGDVLFQGSIGRTDFPRGNHQQLLDSITHRLWPMGGDTAFVPGHGPVSTFAHERATNPFVGDAVLTGG